MKLEKCDMCKANKVCDHNRFGFENCDNYISSDAVEVKRGEWIETDRFVMHNNDFVTYCCSICETKSGGRYNFCPNCGADMRGESDG